VASLSKLAGIAVSALSGVGPRHRQALEALGVTTVADLITHYPRKYIDRTNQRSIAELKDSEQAMALVRVRKVTSRRTRSGRNLVEVDFSDGTGYLRASFFNQPWRTRQLSEGAQVVVFGTVERYRGRLQMTNPVVDLIGDKTGRIVSIYPQSEKAGVSTWQLAQWVSQALERSRPIDDPIPSDLLGRLGMGSREWAFSQIHHPDSLEAAMGARRRLAFDELLRLQLLLVLRKKAMESSAAGIRHRVDGPLLESFAHRLPFALTAAQRKAVGEILTDMARPTPMHRLLQGDVGSGKTVVAAHALLAAVDGGHQGALMAPTEVLADQHYSGVSELLAGLEVRSEGSLLGRRPLQVALLTSRTPAAARRRIVAALAEGEVDLVVGTHALLSEQVGFRSLGVVVIDEQHRFGVEQRAALKAKGSARVLPDVLVMTATPIPRTAAMTVYGDLDTTILDQLPPGRTPVVTIWARTAEAEAAAWERVRQQASEGHQAYVVCPLVDDSDKVAARSATAEWERLVAGELSGLRVGLMHGQLSSTDKEAVMSAFRAGELDVMVSTTVIEVGVDVPNATVMVIEDAGRFGIAQVHQLRGRVGRGSDPSWCYLLGAASDPDTQARLEALERSTDGFELAEVDLELRGEGTILGVRQKGVNDLKLASLRRDRELVALARKVAFELVERHQGLAALPALGEELRQLVDPEEADFLFKS